jgi:hypothetical protein
MRTAEAATGEEAKAPIKGNQGGVSNEKIKHIASTLESARANAKDYTDSANDAVKAFADEGGDKAAIRNAVKLSRMEPQDFLAFWRNLEHYCDVLGLFDQPDMFDEQQIQ